MTPTNQNPDHGAAGRNTSGADKETIGKKIEKDAHDVKREATDKARDTAESGRHRISEEAGNLSDAIDAAASNLDDNDREGLARYTRELSSNLSQAAGQLEGKSVDELANDAKRLARENPAMFMLGSIAVGFGLSRFFKASAEDGNDAAGQGRGDAQRGTVSNGTAAHRSNPGVTEPQAAATAPYGGNGRNTV